MALCVCEHACMHIYTLHTYILQIAYNLIHLRMQLLLCHLLYALNLYISFSWMNYSNYNACKALLNSSSHPFLDNHTPT